MLDYRRVSPDHPLFAVWQGSTCVGQVQKIGKYWTVTTAERRIGFRDRESAGRFLAAHK